MKGSDNGEDTSDDYEVQEEDLRDFCSNALENIKADAAFKEVNDPISGNLYSYFAVKDFGEATDPPLFPERKEFRAMTVALYFVIVIQLIGPVAILVYAVYNLAPSDIGEPWGLDGWRYILWSKKFGISNLWKRVLALLFIILFALNGTHVMHKQARVMEKKLDLCAVFDFVAKEDQKDVDGKTRKTPPPATCWLWVDAIVNSWCLILCTLSTVPIMLFAEGPKDVLFDALGLMFLYNLDDIGGDLGLLEDEWDEKQFGNLFGSLAEHKRPDQSPLAEKRNDSGSDSSPEEDSLLHAIKQTRKNRFTPDNLFEYARNVMFVLSAILPVVYFFINYEERESVEEIHIGALQASVATLQQQVAALTASLGQASAAR